MAGGCGSAAWAGEGTGGALLSTGNASVTLPLRRTWRFIKTSHITCFLSCYWYGVSLVSLIHPFHTFLVRIMVMYSDIKKENVFDSSSRFLLPCVKSVVIGAYLQVSVCLSHTTDGLTNMAATYYVTAHTCLWLDASPPSLLSTNTVSSTTADISPAMWAARNNTLDLSSWYYYYANLLYDVTPSAKGPNYKQTSTKLYGGKKNMAAFVLHWMFSNYYFMVLLLGQFPDDGCKSSCRKPIHTTNMPISTAS